jgi:hypothetical protein
MITYTFAHAIMPHTVEHQLGEKNWKKRSRRSLERNVVRQEKMMSYENIFVVREQWAGIEAGNIGKQSSKEQRKGVKAARREVIDPLQGISSGRG